MKSPFKFLDSYTKDDRAIFFGRDREIEELYQRVFNSKLLLVYGVSGTGKSSLIHCGLANKFLETDWLPMVIRRGGNIIESMASAVSSASLTKQQSKFAVPGDFKKAVRSLYLDHYKPVFFIFDQFEELFIFGDKEERRSFISIVKLLTESDLQCKLIFVMREEYMAGVTEFEKYIPTIFSNRVRIEKMSHRNALDVINQPCKVFNISLEEDFAESLLEKLSPGETDVELTYLQVFLDKIFRLAVNDLAPIQSLSRPEVGRGAGGSAQPKRGGSPAPAPTPALNFSLSLLSKAGNVSDLLGDFLEEQVSLLDNPDDGLAVLKSFVSLKGSRKQMGHEEIGEYAKTLGQPLDDDLLQNLLRTFVNLRILCDKDQKGKYELRHDALAAKIYEKISLVEKEMMEIRQFIENSWNSYQKRGVLISAADLEYIAPYESRLFLPEELEELIRKSKNELVRAKKSRRNLFTYAAILLILVLSTFTFWAIKERNNAVRKEVQARANNFNYLAKEIVNENPTIAMRLVQYAYKLDTTNKDIRNNYYQTYYSNNFYKKTNLLQIRNLFSQAFLPDGKNIISSTRDGTITIHDRKGNLIKQFDGKGKYINYFRFSPDGKYIVSVSYSDTSKLWSRDGKLIKTLDWNGNDQIIGVAPDGKSLLQNGSGGIVNILDLNGRLMKTFKIHEDNVFVGTFSPDGKYIATGSDDKNAIIWDINGKIIQKFVGHEECVNSTAFSTNGKLLLTGSDDNTVRVWDIKGNVLSVLKTGEEIYSAVFFPDVNTIWAVSNFNTICEGHVSLNPKVIFNDKTRINSIEFSPDSKFILAGGMDHSVKLWDLEGNLLCDLSTGSYVPRGTFSNDGNYIITNSRSGNSKEIAKVWDLSGKEIKVITSDSLVVEGNFVDFSENGKYLLVGLANNVILIYDHNYNYVSSINNVGGVVYSVKFSPDGESILTGSFDKTAKLWKIDGTLLKVFPHDHWVISVAFSPDGQSVVTGSLDQTAKLWNVNGELIRVFNCEEEVYSVAFSPDGRNILTGGSSGFAKLWKIDGSLLQIFDTRSVQLWDIAFSRDGKNMGTGSQTGIRLFELKAPIESFLNNDSIEELTVEQKLKYKLNTFSDILNSPVEETVCAGAEYFLWESMIASEPEQKNGYLKNASRLYEKAMQQWQSNKILIGLYSVYSLELAQQTGSLKDSSKLNNLFNKLLSSEVDSELKETADYFYNKVDIYQSDTLQIRYFSKAISFYEKAYKVTSSIQNLESLTECIDNLSLAYLNTGDYTNAINSAQRGIEIKDNMNIRASLVLAYVQNNQPGEAETTIEEIRNNPDNYKELKRVLLYRISRLESTGTTHPGFEKVKELLK